MTVLLPAGEELFYLGGRKTFDFLRTETVGLVVENVAQFFAKSVDDCLGGLGTDSREKAAAEVGG